MSKLIYTKYTIFIFLFLSIAFADYYEVELNSTGESHLIIFLDSVEGLSIGDEIGIFDLNGVLESVDSGQNPEYGEVLVGAGVWDGEANEQGTVAEVSAIMSVDLSDFGGPVLNGAIDGNDIIVRVYDVSENLEYNTTPTFGVGGEFGDIFTTVITLLIEE
jgi:hypothetical protein